MLFDTKFKIIFHSTLLGYKRNKTVRDVIREKYSASGWSFRIPFVTLHITVTLAIKQAVVLLLFQVELFADKREFYIFFLSLFFCYSTSLT